MEYPFSITIPLSIMAAVAVSPSVTGRVSAGTANAEQWERTSDPDAVFWSQICQPALSGMLDFAGTYPPEEKENHLRFLAQGVCPWIGPRLLYPGADASSPYEASTPVEMSINFSHNRKPIVRFQLEPTVATKGPHIASEEPLVIGALSKVLKSAAALPGVELDWVRQLLASMVPAERADIVSLNKAVSEGQLPAPLDHVTHLQLAFDLDLDGRRKMKAYFNPMGMQLARGRAIRDVAFDAITQLEPFGSDLARPLRVVGDFMAASPDAMEVLMTGVDATDPAAARVKLYTYLRDANCWEAVRRAWTLGGAAADDADRLAGLDLLRSVWPLLLDEPAARADLETYNKPPKVALSFLGTLLLTYEFRHDTRVPDVKLYLPLWQYAPTDRRIAANVTAVLRKLGWAEAADGYMAHLQRTFPGADLDGPAALHSYLSFSYSRKTGPYLSLYYSINGKAVRAAGSPGFVPV